MYIHRVRRTARIRTPCDRRLQLWSTPSNGNRITRHWCRATLLALHVFVPGWRHPVLARHRFHGKRRLGAVRQAIFKESELIKAVLGDGPERQLIKIWAHSNSAVGRFPNFADKISDCGIGPSPPPATRWATRGASSGFERRHPLVASPASPHLTGGRRRWSFVIPAAYAGLRRGADDGAGHELSWCSESSGEDEFAVRGEAQCR